MELKIVYMNIRGGVAGSMLGAAGENLFLWFRDNGSEPSKLPCIIVSGGTIGNQKKHLSLLRTEWVTVSPAVEDHIRALFKYDGFRTMKNIDRPQAKINASFKGMCALPALRKSKTIENVIGRCTANIIITAFVTWPVSESDGYGDRIDFVLYQNQGVSIESNWVAGSNNNKSEIGGNIYDIVKRPYVDSYSGPKLSR